MTTYIILNINGTSLALDTLLTDEKDQPASSLFDVGREHETLNWSARAQWGVALTAVHVDDVPESDVGERQVGFYGHTVLQNVLSAFHDHYGKWANVISKVIS